MTAKENLDLFSFALFDDKDFYDLSVDKQAEESLKRNFSTYNDDSISHTDDTQNNFLLSDPIQVKKPGRKISIENDEEKIKRKAQNRAAQRAFRERKERYVKDLEKKSKQFEDRHMIAVEQLLQENQYLRSIINRLEMENCVLKGTPADAVESVTKALENARSSLPLPTPPSLEKFKMPFKPPLPPLQIRPMQNNFNNPPNQKVQKKGNGVRADKSFTFSVTTPDILQTKRRPIQLYSGQNHPTLKKKKDISHQKEQVETNKPSVDVDQKLNDLPKPVSSQDNGNTHDRMDRTTPLLVPERKPNERYHQPYSKLWQRVSEHASNPKFSVDQLLNAVKQSITLANERLVLDEWDMEQMLEDF
ncbi:unnamed protein product [Rhizopus stolonifer]